MTTLGDRVSDPAGSGCVLAIALAFFSVGAFLLVFTGATLGALHAFAAFIVLAIVAALNQLLPVLTGAPVARPYAVVGISTGLAAGFALLIAGFYGAHTLFFASIVLGVSAFAWVAWNAVRLCMGRNEFQTRALIACTIAAFAVAAGIGASMAGALGGHGSAAVLALAPVHAATMILGFGSLLIVGISYRFVPMFAVAHGTAYGRRGLQWIAVAAVVLVTVSLHEDAGLRVGLAVLLAAASFIARSHAKTLSSRLRKRLDVSLRYACVAWTFAIAGLAIALWATWEASLWPSALIAGMLGWICITILGYAYKVAGFLAWQAAKERDPGAQLPALSGAVGLPLAYSALALLAIGTSASAVLNIAAPQYAQIGYGLYAAGALCAVAALARLASIYIVKGNTDGIAAGTLG